MTRQERRENYTKSRGVEVALGSGGGGGGGGAIRNGFGLIFRSQNRLPSGVKKPAPVVVGTEGLGCASSGGFRLIGGGRGGNISSISGIEPS